MTIEEALDARRTFEACETVLREAMPPEFVPMIVEILWSGGDIEAVAESYNCTPSFIQALFNVFLEETGYEKQEISPTLH